MDKKYEFTDKTKEFRGRILHRKKYEFTGETKGFYGRTLHRIKRVKDGLIGGWIENERNLSHEGSCFVCDDAIVFDNAMIRDDVMVCGNAMVYGNAKVCDNAMVYGDAEVCGNAMVYGNAEVYNNAMVYGDARVCDDAMICDYATVCDDARVENYARVYDDAIVCGYAEICDNARVYKGRITGQISQPYKDIFQHQCKNRVLTAILTENDEILYTIGCQNNITKEVFLDKIYNEGGGLEKNPYREEYLKLIPAIEQYFKN